MHICVYIYIYVYRSMLYVSIMFIVYISVLYIYLCHHKALLGGEQRPSTEGAVKRHWAYLRRFRSCRRSSLRSHYKAGKNLHSSPVLGCLACCGLLCGLVGDTKWTY